MAILCGMGITYLRLYIIKNIYRYAFLFICIILFMFLGIQSWQINFKFPSAPENPYTYGHARDQVKIIPDTLQQIEQRYPAITNTRIDVIAKNGAYWPLPWYLRKFKRVAWRDVVPENIASIPIVLIAPEMKRDFTSQLYEKTPFEKRRLYLPLFDNEVELRPGVMISGYIHKDLWEKTAIRQ